MKIRILSRGLLISGLVLFLTSNVFAQVGLKVDANGKVGIGTTNPGALLHINDTGGILTLLRLSGKTSGTVAHTVQDASGIDNWQINAGANGYSIIDGSQSSCRILINNNGNVGIGTTNPQYKLHVESAGTAIYSNTTGSSVYAGRFNGATHGLLGYAGTYGVVGISYAAGTKFGVYGDAQGGGYDFFAINTDGSVAYGTGSSIRQKANITRISNPLDKVMAIEGVSFDWNGSGVHNIGFIAERLGEIVPEIVVFEEASNESNWYIDEKTGEKKLYASGLDYGAITPLLAEAIKELKAEKDSEIADLKAQNAALKQALCELNPALTLCK